ncbi:DUF4041 domain-containing protein [Ligilactobacillus salivarius]|uniref:DUF4041 domain-containing protein n=1 Tax=Ligilactobacillus salivarius TaxID=1624 RepID=A0A6N9IQ43_9LACO|nr:DUF4041 domain-containing protein [Ligilactobacillus salivarius]MDM8261902.1 DUF4041 domain-containing protein [Ligilactobacillus salivarius]MYY64482.1 DUF4041 domain-containing protein [Ligilactobacillus salivarius]
MAVFFLIFLVVVILLFIASINSRGYSNKVEKLESLNEKLQWKEQQLDNREMNISNRERELSELKNEISKLTKNIKSAKKEYNDILKSTADILKNKDSELAIFEESYRPTLVSSLIPLKIDDKLTSSEVRNKLVIFRDENKDLVKNNSVEFYKTFDSKLEKSNLQKKILLLFNSEVAGLLNKLTLSNINSIRNKIVTSYERANKLFKNDGVQISRQYFEYKLNELDFNYQYLVKKNDEKEQQAAIKEQMIDEAKAQKELEKEQRRIEKEQRKFNNELDKTMKYLSKSTDSIQSEIYAEKIKELEAKIKELESDKANVTKRLANTRAGYVYVISNIGSFGDNVYKIGMTKRLNPLDRVNELGSASVPFKFDVHAMIFSDDAPTLENHLHKVFADKSVNKVNSRKEFFNVTLKEIEKEVLDNFDATVEFTEYAKAEEYRRSLELREE